MYGVALDLWVRQEAQAEFLYTRQETSIEFEQDYYQALQTHLAGGAGLSDIQGIEVARIAEVTQTQADIDERLAQVRSEQSGVA